ncbi:unnamed protein product [Urochloa decumbens]|uniref:F-box domain-containing protein n=1 Tax=Urochloa decumbens TaxID=240449 RepID=A0ABC8YCL4_9POAL
MKCPCDPDPMAEASSDALMVPAGGACMINALPNPVLIHAISFLDARQLVRTCVLSRRWRNLWRSVPRINASFEKFKDVSSSWIEWSVLFKKFFNRFLMLRNPTPLDEFNLMYYVDEVDPEVDSKGCHYKYYAESEDANLWIRHALQCNARSVNVSVHHDGAKLYLDSVVFASKCFLTSLELTWVILFTGFFENLQMGCTMLERLKLYGCSINDAEISSQTLKLFTIDTGCLLAEQTSISIPSLIDLGYLSEDIGTPLLKNLGSLETATVSIGTKYYDTPLSDICQFLRGLSDVTHLDLLYEGRKLKMEKNFHWCPKFNNLTILTLGEWCLCADFYALTVFLQNSPNLMKLILNIRENPGTCEKFIGQLEETYFTCEHLKLVEIVCPEDWEDDPMLNDLEDFLVGNGIRSDQIEIKNW